MLQARKRNARTSCTSGLKGRRFRAQGIWLALSRSVTSARQCWTLQRMATLLREGPCACGGGGGDRGGDVGRDGDQPSPKHPQQMPPALLAL